MRRWNVRFAPHISVFLAGEPGWMRGERGGGKEERRRVWKEGEDSIG